MKLLNFFLPTALCGFLPVFEQEIMMEAAAEKMMADPGVLIIQPFVATGFIVTSHQAKAGKQLDIYKIFSGMDPSDHLGRTIVSKVWQKKGNNGGGGGGGNETSTFENLVGLAADMSKEESGKFEKNTTMWIRTNERLYEFQGNVSSFTGTYKNESPKKFDYKGKYLNVTFIGTRACLLFELTNVDRPATFSKFAPTLQADTNGAYLAFDIFTNQLIATYSTFDYNGSPFAVAEFFTYVEHVSREEIEKSYTNVPKQLQDIATEV